MPAFAHALERRVSCAAAPRRYARLRRHAHAIASAQQYAAGINDAAPLMRRAFTRYYARCARRRRDRHGARALMAALSARLGALARLRVYVICRQQRRHA